MPGSIKIDDGSGNYTILTNAGSLGSDKTITIPNETGTLNLQSGSVLQVVQGTDNSPANITSTSYVDTGLSASITPSSTSSKILVIVSHSAFVYAPGAIPFAYLQLLRDSTDTTTHKLKFIAGDFKSSSVMDGSSTESQTYVIFERLGAT